MISFGLKSRSWSVKFDGDLNLRFWHFSLKPQVEGPSAYFPFDMPFSPIQGVIEPLSSCYLLSLQCLSNGLLGYTLPCPLPFANKLTVQMKVSFPSWQRHVFLFGYTCRRIEPSFHRFQPEASGYRIGEGVWTHLKRVKGWLCNVYFRRTLM